LVEGKLTIKSFAKGNQAGANVESVRLLGHLPKINWQQTDEGLVIDLPENKPCEHAWSFEIKVTE
jgi:alpha-L-fucosidase